MHNIQSPAVCRGDLRCQYSGSIGIVSFNRSECCSICRVCCTSDRLYAWRQCHTDLYDTAVFPKVRKCIYCFRCTEFLYLHRQRTFDLRNRVSGRAFQLEYHDSGLDADCTDRHCDLLFVCQAMEQKRAGAGIVEAIRRNKQAASAAICHWHWHWDSRERRRGLARDNAPA